jgi:8-oxo-dGTP pyrophosphatase MutT (NUDIX family)
MDWQQVEADTLEAALRQALARGLPGRAAQQTMAPELAYGRHRGPVPTAARPAAVLVLLDQSRGEWSIPAMLRPATMKSHAGQISLPGGLVEPGETAHETALREFTEELGCPAEGLSIVGTLTPVFVFISGFVVTPVIAVNRRPLVFCPNPLEVAAVVPLPMAQLLDPAYQSSHLIRRQELAFRAPHYEISGHRVWGATSLILAEFAALAADLDSALECG